MNAAARKFLLLTVVGVVGATNSPAADPPPFSITISSPQQTWKTGSAVLVTVILTNTSAQTVFLAKSFAPGGGEMFMDVEVKDEQGNPLPRTKYYRDLREELVWGGSVHKKFLKPGETLNDGIVVSRLFDLGRIGKYTIRVQRRDTSTHTVVMSNTITVTVSD